MTSRDPDSTVGSVARYRVGNAFLSESEYDAHQRKEQETRALGWAIVAGVVAAIALSLLASEFVSDQWPKALRFGAKFLAPATGGYLIIRYRRILGNALTLGLGLALLVGVLYACWSLVSLLWRAA